MSAKSYIVKKINELPTFTGALSPDDLVAFYDISTGITHKIKVSEIGGGSLDHRDLTQESRFANDQHVMGSVVGLVDKIADLDSEDINLQHQIFQIIENSPIDIVRFFTRTQTTLSGQTVYLSSETKGANAAFNITQAVTGTDRATANVIAKFAGDTPLTVERELPAQNTSLFLRLNKNNTQRNVFVFVEFYDYDEGSVLTLKGTTSDFEIRSDVDVYNVLLQIEAYIAQIGARSWIEIKSYQTGVGVAAQTTIGIEGDYYSRFQYRIPAVALSFLDDKLISSQDLPAIGSLAGESQKEVNAKLAGAIPYNFEIVNSVSGKMVKSEIYGRAFRIETVLKSANLTNISVSKNGGVFETLTPPYSVAENDVITYQLTYDASEQAYFTLKCTKL